MRCFESLENKNLLAADGVPASVQHLAGDLDGSGDVGFSDFLILSRSFGELGSPAQGDIDGDGRVGFPDFLILQDNFGLQLGDVNKDGTINVSDAYEIRDAVLDAIAAAEADNLLLDVNSDCAVDLLDLEQVKGLLKETPDADINADGVVDENDLAIVAENMNTEVIGGWIDGDVNEDGIVNFADFILVDPSPF